MSAFEDLSKKAAEFIDDNKDKIGDALKSEQAEEVSDKVLDGAESLGDKITGGKFAEQLKGARDAADGAIGNE
ncbi:Rv0909 family putative TA system antitoxin [Protaetiibacter larvae]|uniref:Antitoxin n=1 Tax=Protaetiibacter larvae TaxID=2592654 RepID=A0A5C1Y5F2_9MICO|nr:Rv0909 family putative TA system antitoxin [Protaetiibacter larvae]QEO09124.1 antitoxin [Protaetiibacter larvae]